MRIFNWHIAKNLLGTLLLAMGILTFVMMSVHLFRVFTMLANGASPALLAKVLLFLLPDILRYALPFSILIATVLVFSRMSADNEIVALKASGIGIWQITAPALVIALVICAISVWLGASLSPQLRYASEQLRLQAMTDNPLALLEPGTVTRLSSQASIRVGGRDEKTGLLKDIYLHQLDKDGKTLRDITADSCMIDLQPDNGEIQLVLYRFTISERPVTGEAMESYREADGQNPHFLAGDTLTIPLPYSTYQDKKALSRKLKMMPFKMLMGNLAWTEAQGKPVAKHWYEFHQRLALAFSPLAFLLLGIPFGIRNRRSETTSGLVICLLLALGYYAVMLLCDSLVASHPELHPEFIIWLPNLAYEIGGLLALAKIARH